MLCLCLTVLYALVSCVLLVLVMSLLLEIVVCLGKVLWLCLIALLKSLNPFKPKKNVSLETVLVTGAGSGIGRLMAIRLEKSA